MMARTASSFQRSKGVRETNPQILIVCEDTKSCADYLADAAHHFRVYAKVEIKHCGKTDPLGIVNYAIERRHEFDIIYCAIDRDSHLNFSEALQKADLSGVEIIASYPCYEYWIQLHFNQNRKPYASAGKKSAADFLIKDLMEILEMRDYDKGGSKGLFKKLLPRLPDARKRASLVLVQAVECGELNPSTQIHQLIEKFHNISDSS